MALNFDQISNQLQAFIGGLTIRQKVTLVAGVALVAGTLWAFVTMLGKADYKTLYSGLSPSDAATMTKRLTEKNIPYQLSSDSSSIMVRADELDKARLEMAAGGTPQTARLGFEIFDKPNWAGSDFAEKVNYQRALEGELERTIQTLDDVDAVRVHLVLPHESLFTEQEREAKATVVIKLKGGRLGDDAQEAITHLVASAVDNLRAENVSLINAEGGMPILARSGGGSTRPRQLAEMEAALAQKVVATLEPVVGPGKARADVNVEYDTAASDSTQEIYDPNGAVVLTSQISAERVGETGAGGVPGTTSNVPGKQDAAGVKQTAAADSQTQGLETENKTFAVSKTVRHVMQPSGNLKRITAAVLVDDAIDVTQENGKQKETRRKRTPEEMKQLEELVTAAIGADPTRGDKVAVANLSFQTLPIEHPAPPSLTERVVPIVDKWISVIRYVALGLLFMLVYMLVLRPVKRQIVTTLHELPRQVGAMKSARASLKGRDAANSEAAAALDAKLQGQLENTAPELKQAALLKKNLLEKVKKEPETASRLIQNWVRQENKI